MGVIMLTRLYYSLRLFSYKKYILFLVVLLVVCIVAIFNQDAKVKAMNHSLVKLPIIVQQASLENIPLEINKPINRQIKEGEIHYYQIDVMEDQYLQVLLEQKGIDVAVDLIDFQGNKIAGADNLYGERGIENLEIITKFAETYKVTVVANSLAGEYEIQLKQLRKASLKDKTFVSEKLLAEEILAQAHQQGDPLVALEYFEKALPHCKASENKPLEAEALNEMGIIHKRLGNVIKAEEYYKKVLIVVADLDDLIAKATFESGSHNNLGELYYEQGRFQEAFDRFKKAYEIGKSVKIAAATARPLNNLANCYLSFGDIKKAIELYTEALLIHQKSGDQDAKNSEVAVLNNLGAANFYLNNIAEAKSFYQQSIAKNTFDILTKAKSLKNLGCLYANTKDYSKALDCLQQALEIFQNNVKAEEGHNLLLIGQVYKNRPKNNSKDKDADISKAFEYLNKALERLQTTERITWIANTFYELADLKFQTGNFKDAQTDIEHAIQIFTFIRSNIINFEFRLAYNETLQNGYELYITLLMNQHLKEPNAGYDIQAFRASEQARAKAFLDLLIESGVDIKEGVSSKILDKEQNLQNQLSKQQNELITLLKSESARGTETSSTKIQEIKIKQEETLRNLREVLTEIRQQSPKYATLIQPQPLEIDTLQKQVLDSESLLLEYFLGTNESYLWAITQTSIKTYKLPKREEIKKLTTDVYNIISKENPENPKAYWQVAAKLSKVIFPNFEQFQKKRLIVVPHYSLQYIPFGALPIPTANKNHKKNNLHIPLIQNNEIVSLPAANIMVLLRQRVSNQKTLKTLVVADPVFTQDDDRVSLFASNEANKPNRNQTKLNSTLRSNFERLLYSSKEATEISKLVPKNEQKLLLDFKASKDNFLKEDLSLYRFIHFATHGLINSVSPELSGLVLSLVDENKELQNGFLALHEIYKLKLDADLVTLSSCESALGKDLEGDGIIGLTGGFMCAGTSRVLSSLWKVNDRATSQLMEKLYQKIFLENKTPAHALRLAQLELLQDKDLQFPFYWAAFQLQGEWK